MKKLLLLLVYTLILFSCSSSNTQETELNPDSDVEIVENNSNEWSIPISEVLDGGPGRDGIPALENPVMVTADNASILQDSDLVLGYKNGNDIRAYQHIILDWHEIINDKIGDVSMAITYCPLTGTGFGWNRIIKGKETTFGVSGLLYQTNLMPFDRATKSNWSQLLNASVNGNLIGEKAEMISLVETDWNTWRTMYPNTKIVGLNTGFSRTYGVYPYVDYKTNQTFFLFPTPKDDRLPAKERVHAIIDNEKSKVYRFSDFISNNVLRDTFNGKDYLIVGNANFIVSFELNTVQAALNFNYAFDANDDVILRDSNGKDYTLFGEIVPTSNIGGNLKRTSSFMGYWFSIPAFYTTTLYGD